MMATDGTYASLIHFVLIPGSAPYLRFSYRIVGSRSCDTSSSGDYVWVYSDDWRSQWDVGACSTAGWVTGTLDMTSEAGEYKEITFKIVTYAFGGTVYFDDIGFVSAPTREVDYY